jgi:hypothetical protein
MAAAGGLLDETGAAPVAAIARVAVKRDEALAAGEDGARTACVLHESTP